VTDRMSKVEMYWLDVTAGCPSDGSPWQQVVLVTEAGWITQVKT
jgi:hypothetical protein